MADDKPQNPIPLAPEPTPPVLAPPAIIDRYPITIGQNLSGQYLSAQYRLGTQGWRYGFVDVINELLENDPHSRGVVRQRILGVAGASVEINPPKLPKNHQGAELAKEIAEFFAYDFEALPALSQSLGQLNWGVVYGVSGAETDWNLDPEVGWEPTGIRNVHSRRLNYPDPSAWDLYIYDMGMVGPGLTFGPTTGLRGLKVSNYPGKFVIHTPALNADYPTRDGEARYIGVYMLLKRLCVRATAQDFERVIRPWVVGYFNREIDPATKQAIALPEDKDVLADATKKLGDGQLNAAVLPNSVKLEILRAASSMELKDWLTFLNQEISKSVLGQAFTTEPGANGNFAAMDIANKNTLKILRYDAQTLADTLKRDFAMPWMRLRYPLANRRLCPDLKLQVYEVPDPQKIASILTSATAIDIPVDARWAGEQLGLKLIPPAEGEEPIRTRAVAAGKSVEPGADPNDPGAEPDEAEPVKEPKPEAKANDPAKPQVKRTPTNVESEA